MIHFKKVIIFFLIYSLNSCVKIKNDNIKGINSIKSTFYYQKSSKILHDTYVKFLKNPNFFRHKYQDKSIKYFNMMSIFYSLKKDGSYTFSNEITQQKAKELQKEYYSHLNSNKLVDKYIYKVDYDKNILVHSISRNEELLFNSQGKIIVQIYPSSKNNIRFTYYFRNHIDVVDCDRDSKTCILHNYNNETFLNDFPMEYPIDIDKKIYTQEFYENNITYQVRCDILYKKCTIISLSKNK